MNSFIIGIHDIENIIFNFLHYGDYLNLYKTNHYYYDFVKKQTLFQEYCIFRKYPHMSKKKNYLWKYMLTLNLQNLFNKFYKGKNLNECFIICCQNNLLKSAKFICTQGDPRRRLYSPEEECNYFLKKTCSNGHLEMTQWIYNTFSQNKMIPGKCFFDACESGNFELVKWLHTVSGFPNEKIQIKIIELFMVNDELTEESKQLFLWLLSFKEFINDDDIQELFKQYCLLKNVEMVKSIIQIRQIYIQNVMFKQICEKNILNIAELFICITEINISYDIIHEIFVNSCSSNHFEMARFLYKLNSQNNKFPKINIHHKNEMAFRKACSKNNLKIAKWLLSLDKIQIIYK